MNEIDDDMKRTGFPMAGVVLSVTSSKGNAMRNLFFTAVLSLVVAFSGSAHAGTPEMRASTPTGITQGAIAFPAEWTTAYGQHTQVHSAPEHARTARRLADHADEAVPRLGGVLGLPAGRRVTVVLAPDEETFASMQPGRPPTWADGTAWPMQNLVFLHAPEARRGDASPLETVLEHELVHIMLGQAFAPRRVPHWLQEGTAQVLAQEVRPDSAQKLASIGDQLIPLKDLTGSWPSDPVRAQRAYAQSAHFVAHLRNTYGQEAFRALVGRMARGQPVDAALRGATDDSLTQIDQAWRARFASSPMWLQQVVTDTTLLGLGGIGLVVGFFSVRRRRRERLARWAREEQLQDAIYAALAGDGWDGRAPLPTPEQPVWPHPRPASDLSH
ncbi:MAG: hypothetical protein VX265_14120 [Myxococcota bacterium]|nr:hypothetical protein [Myxococcota bacterium]MEC8423560.1 hypothetical protein [Myxococcota bacterium]